MKNLYLLINLATIIVPLIAAYHPKIRFYKNHKEFFIAIGLSGSFFILWDVWFATKEVWGFSDAYTIGFGLFGLPIEECLFFLCIPYASLFLHIHLHKFRWLEFMTFKSHVLTFLSSVLVVGVLIIGIWNYDKSYTFVNALVFLIIYSIAYVKYKQQLTSFLSSFIIILVPFFVVNGLLTGTGISEEVVWYNNQENLGIRLGTIPVEDVFYAFSILMLPLLIYNQLKKSSIVKS